MTEESKKAFVHRLYQHRGNDELWGSLDWIELFERIEALPPEDRYVEQTLIDPIRRGDAYLLGLLKPQSPDYLVRLGEDGRVIDLMSDEEDGAKDRDGETPRGAPPAIFHTSVVLLLPIGDAFAITLGSNHSPRDATVVKLVEKLHDRQDEFHWTKMALMDRGKIKQLREGRGVERFSTTIDTNRTLFDSDDDESLMAAMDHVGDVVGADVEIELTISLKGADNNQGNRAKFRDSIVRGLDRLIPPRSARQGASAKVFDKDGRAEVLDLVEHRMQVQFEVGAAKTEQARYTELVDRLAAASEQIIEAVKPSL